MRFSSLFLVSILLIGCTHPHPLPTGYAYHGRVYKSQPGQDMSLPPQSQQNMIVETVAVPTEPEQPEAAGPIDITEPVPVPEVEEETVEFTAVSESAPEPYEPVPLIDFSAPAPEPYEPVYMPPEPVVYEDPEYVSAIELSGERPDHAGVHHYEEAPWDSWWIAPAERPEPVLDLDDEEPVPLSASAHSEDVMDDPVLHTVTDPEPEQTDNRIDDYSDER